jgi:uncharacterized membrane protein YkvA (DUF1232 family)
VLARVFRALALLRDPRVARLPRAAVLAAFLYALWPLDLLPDWVPPVIGWIDDITLVWLALRWLGRSAPQESAPAVPPARPAGPASP